MTRMLILIAAFAAAPVAADEGFSLGLTEMDFTPAAEESSVGDVSAMVDDEATERGEVLAFQAALRPTNAAEHTEALWNSDFGRLHYAMAAEQARLGREGLVNGERMLGVGLGTAAIGDGDPNGALGMALGRGKWVEMNANEKLQAVAEASFIAALLAFMVSAAD